MVFDKSMSTNTKYAPVNSLTNVVATFKKKRRPMKITTTEKNKFHIANQYPRFTPVNAMNKTNNPKPTSNRIGLAKISKMAVSIGSSKVLKSILNNIPQIIIL
jgi:hypothetical protein